MTVLPLAPTPSSATGSRGLRVVAVLDRRLAHDDAATLLARRLADELPPDELHVVCITPPAWQQAAGLDPAVACLEGGFVCWPHATITWCTLRPVEPSAVQHLGERGLTATAAWSRTGWRSTLRRTAREHAGRDLLLAMSVTPRRTPAVAGAGPLRMEQLALRPLRRS